jgi:RNA polymerase sigma-70 factor, ECF subfamily
MGMQLDQYPGEGPAGAFEQFCLSFGPKVRAMLLRRGADPVAVGDIACRVLLAAWQACGLPQDPAHLSASTYCAARDTSTRQLRKQMIWQGERGTNPMAPSAHPSWCGPDAAPKTDRLSPDQLQVIGLSLIDGLSQEEIATRLNMSLSSVRELMQTACARLRDMAGRQ